jgi:L-ascorbate metabolism protein UlaG (beta-lactamase superfamily)
MTARYANSDPRHTPHSGWDVFRWSVLDRLTGRRRVAPPGPAAPSVPYAPGSAHDGDGAARITWIGHASFLVSVPGASFLVDPVFSRRIGLVVQRHGRAGLLPADLPALDALLVTHNHYDHLDTPSVRSLRRDLPVLAPAGLGSWFLRRGFANVTEMRWWDRANVGSLAITFVPSRHWSRRYIGDTNRSAWGGFVVQAGATAIYHAGDSGWFDGFAEIGSRCPAIDLALLPIGAYAPPWFMERHHMNPEQAIDALCALRARAMVPMHWGAFQLTDEPLCEPLARLRLAWDDRRPAADLHILAVGETLTLR